MNFKVVMWLFTQLLAKIQGDFYEPNSIFIRKFPIPESREPAIIERIVDRILREKSVDPDTDIFELEHKIDQEVYKLFGLTDAEIYIIEDELKT